MPVATSESRSSRLISRLSLPVRAFTLSDHSARLSFSPDGLPSEQPDFPSLPAGAADYSLMPADHRSRLATVPQAYCSLNLLEPTQ